MSAVESNNADIDRYELLVIRVGVGGLVLVQFRMLKTTSTPVLLCAYPSRSFGLRRAISFNNSLV